MTDNEHTPMRGAMVIGEATPEMVEQWGAAWARDFDRRERRRRATEEVERARMAALLTPIMGQRCADCLAAEPVYENDGVRRCWTCHREREWRLHKVEPPAAVSTGDEALPGRVTLTPAMIRALNYLVERGCGCHAPDATDADAEAVVQQIKDAALQST